MGKERRRGTGLGKGKACVGLFAFQVRKPAEKMTLKRKLITNNVLLKVKAEHWPRKI